MYRITDPKLSKTVDRLRAEGKDSKPSFSEEILFLKSLIQEVSNECESSTERLERLAKPLQSVIAATEKLQRLELATGALLSKQAIIEVVKQLVQILSEGMSMIPESQRDQVIDFVAPQLLACVESANNDE